MKIMHIIDSGGLYGAEMMLLELMSAQSRLGLKPFLCSMGTTDHGEKAIEREAKRRGLNVIELRTRAGLNPYAIYQLLATARSAQADIIHSHGYKGNILAGLIPREIRKIPFLCTVHGWTNTVAVSKLAVYEWLDRTLLRHKDAVVLVNRLMLKDLRFKSAHVDSRKLHVVNNGISTDISAHADNQVMQKISNFSGAAFTIGAIGRLSPEKGYEHLLAATATLYRAGHDIRLIIFGDGPLKEELQHQVTKLDITPIVLFTGYLANANAYLPCLDVLAISSLSEGLPITLLEAMRAGVPVVSTRVGGIPDVISNEISGILVPVGNPDELAEGIKLLIDNPDLSEQLARNAAERFRENYSSEKMARDYLAIYNSLRISK